jgi:hypothetical protein
MPCSCAIACAVQMGASTSALNTLSEAEKHAKALRELGFHAIFLPASLYAMAAQAGYDMTRYVIQRAIPEAADE